MAAWSQSRIEVVPQFVSLGSFSVQDPGSNLPNPGSTTLRITSLEPWSVYVTLVQPARRLSDNVELPLERVRQIFPDLSQFCSYVPVQLDYGPGDAGVQTVTYDWQLAQSRLAEYVREADPPGVYRFSVRFELQDREGHMQGRAETIVVEFSIQSYVKVELSDAGFELPIEHPGEPAESDPLYVTVSSNTAWALQMTWGGDLVRENSPDRIDYHRVSWIVWGGDEWESLIPGYTSVNTGLADAARGEAPAPFSLTEVQVPLQIRVQTEVSTVAGMYSCGVRFFVHTEPESGGGTHAH